MQFQITSTSRITVEQPKSSKTVLLKCTEVALEIPSEFERSEYYGSDELLTKAGVDCSTQCFVQGLIANIHYAHQHGLIDSAEHLRYIISELERGFVEVVDIRTGLISESQYLTPNSDLHDK